MSKVSNTPQRCYVAELVEVVPGVWGVMLERAVLN